MALRLNRQLMAVYSYILVWGGTMLAMQLGIFSYDTPHKPLFASLLVFNAIVFALIRSGASKIFSDPSLTIAQMLSAITLVTALLHYAEEMRGAMISIYFMVMTFGVFALDRTKMIVMSAVVIVAFTGLIVYEFIYSPKLMVFSLAVGQWMILLLGLIWFVFVGGYIHNLQQRIREQRESLRDNHSRLEESHTQLHAAMEKLAEIAVRDSLTGLYNRRHFIERLEEAIAIANRSREPFYLALIDLDHFKQVNDLHGHQVGDEILVRFSTLARQTLRRSDVLARYGGEEFIVLFPDGGREGITEVLERLRESFAAMSHDDLVPGLKVTLSAGLAGWRPEDNSDSLTRRADDRLYAAKHQGRNRLQAS
ncbi:diguanylate cyclase [Alcanivorax sp. 1008]|uniref:GGDEF domain-containing protein n=1 Tax=Alcanivorax sp. 1008 TaxID=2816853 RepID=UPI001E31B5F4|nr:GGDEF domain-containing protein [Alcanivorax sp. 1008]